MEVRVTSMIILKADADNGVYSVVATGIRSTHRLIKTALHTSIWPSAILAGGY